jgi:hypothetical protein
MLKIKSFGLNSNYLQKIKIFIGIGSRPTNDNKFNNMVDSLAREAAKIT